MKNSFRGFLRREQNKAKHIQRAKHEEKDFLKNASQINIDYWAFDHQPETVFRINIKLILDNPVIPNNFVPKLNSLLEEFINDNF